MNDYFPIVVQVVPFDDFHVHVYFDDGRITDYDMSDKLDGTVFIPLKDISVFKSACTVLNNTLAWDIEGNRDTGNCIDIDPFTLYESPQIRENIA